MAQGHISLSVSTHLIIGMCHRFLKDFSLTWICILHVRHENQMIPIVYYSNKASKVSRLELFARRNVPRSFVLKHWRIIIDGVVGFLFFS
jgi:hypothetical protein